MIGVFSHASLRFRQGALAVCAALVLGGCISARNRVDTSALRFEPSLLVATTRQPVDGAREKPWFNANRSSVMSVARVKLDPPGERRLSLSALRLAGWKITAVEQPTTGSIQPLLAESLSTRDVLVYVHGFNTDFEEAVLIGADLSDGIKFGGETIVFSWPSRGGMTGYGYDHESAMWSRDALESLLDQLAADGSVGTINVVAHSMGTMLTLEALRQRAARLGSAAANKMGAIVFASPDIDMDVFSSSVDRIGPLARHITVVVSTEDRALKASRKLYGGITRVGGVEKAELARLGIRVIDASDQGWGVIKHDLFLSNDEVRRAVRRAMDSPTTLTSG